MTLSECRDGCASDPACNYFTWFEDEPDYCLQYRDCDGYDPDACQNCYTGNENCTVIDYECLEYGFCYNAKLVASDFTENPKSCLSLCRSTPMCNYFSYDGNNAGFCLLTEDCPAMDPGCIDSSCVYGQVECEVTQDTFVMIATGFNQRLLDHVEIIDMNESKSCNVLPVPFPLEVSGSVAVNHNDRVTICGGDIGNDQYSPDCYSYDWAADQWNIEPFQIQPARYGAMAAEIRPGEWLIMGGRADQTIFSDTFLLSNGIVTSGPPLPEPIYLGSAVMMSEDKLFVAAGYNATASTSQANYLLDVDSMSWSPVASRLSTADAWGHATGTFYNSTADEIQVATLSRITAEIYSPRSDSWQISDTSSYPPAGTTEFWYSAAVQAGRDSFRLFGGFDGDDVTSALYKFDESGFDVVEENALAMARNYHVAINIPKDQVNCN